MGQGSSGITSKGDKSSDSTLEFEPGLKIFPPRRKKPVKEGTSGGYLGSKTKLVQIHFPNVSCAMAMI